MPDKRARAVGRRTSGKFFAMPLRVMDHENYINLSSKAKDLLFEFGRQLRYSKDGGARNNGDLCVTISLMKDRGWKSKESLDFAIRELTHYGFIVKTRSGGMGFGPDLYALTFLAIDECEGKLEIGPTNVPSNEWAHSRQKWCRPQRKKLEFPPRNG